MKANVNAFCVGCGLCMEICPGVFRMDETENRAAGGIIPEGELDKAREAEEKCPSGAITVENN